MSNGTKTTKRERQRARAEQRRIAERRSQQRRVLGVAFVSLAVIAVAVVAILAVQGGSGGSSPIRPSAVGDVTAEGPARATPLEVGEAAPAFSAPGFRLVPDGDAFAVERGPVAWEPGEPTVISIWAEWCPHCQVELPVLQQVVSGYPDIRLVTILSSTGARPGPEPDAYLGDHGLTFPVAVDDDAGTLAQAFGLEAFPTIYLVDSDGIVAYAATGELPAEDLRARLDLLR
jgi:thiol-disulfide isomerase/thioredoxin